MKLIDAFIFCNEIDILKGRLEYLYDIVDYFVIVESNITFSGIKREFLYPKFIDEFKKYTDKILYFPLTLDSLPNNNIEISFDQDYLYSSASWIREEKVRNHILVSLKLFNDDDILMISDVDEIPNKSSIKEAIKQVEIKNYVSFIQDIIYYNLQHKETIQCYATILVPINFIKSNGLTIELLRRNRFKMPIIENAGWHLTSWFSPKGIQTKIKNFAHQELNNDEFNNPNNFLQNMLNNEDIFGTKLITVNSDYYPKDFYDVFIKYSKDYVTIED